MPTKVPEMLKPDGLGEAEVFQLQEQFGKNRFRRESTRRFWHIAADIVQEPMFILLVIACLLYFILGESTEGFMMLAAIAIVTAISVYQETRSSKALEALQQYTRPKIMVIRGGIEKVIDSEDLVPGDIMILEEGNTIPADAEIVQENDLSIDESVITGESFPVEKQAVAGANLLYQGSTVNSGKCFARVTDTGSRTVLGKLGKTISTYNHTKTLLQQQTGRFVKRLALFGVAGFAVVWLINYLQSGSVIQSLLFGLTLAMAALPEEIPVAFSSFMALGAYKMSRLGIISRQPQTIENLGTVTTLCLDKTGTITENKMTVRVVYDFEKDIQGDTEQDAGKLSPEVLYYAMLASEAQPFDAMEKAIHEAYIQNAGTQQFPPLQMVYEYPLQGRPPMMTHVYRQDNRKVVAAKGAAEKILQVCSLQQPDFNKIMERINQLAAKGYRVIGVARTNHTTGDLPAAQENFHWKFAGLVALYDPPKKNMAAVIQRLYDAQITVKLLTGDFPATAVHIAQQVGIHHNGEVISGEEVMNMDETTLQKTIARHHVFARMFPDAKLKVINALKAKDEITAMTGDGVNDGPALKAADIGIAMGKKGTEIARQAADLVLTDDNPEKIIDAIREGRKIFINLKKAIRYIISIHIPIIVTAVLPLLLGWKFPNIFTPIHVIFLELIMGPTCSIFFEREPVESGHMKQPPRNRQNSLFHNDELLTSILQGLLIAAGVLLLYYYYMHNHSITETRTVVFTTLVISNIFLTFTNRSFTENITRTFRYKNNLAPWVILVSVLFLIIIHSNSWVRELFRLSPLSFTGFARCTGIALISVGWFEVYKTLFLLPARKNERSKS